MQAMCCPLEGAKGLFVVTQVGCQPWEVQIGFATSLALSVLESAFRAKFNPECRAKQGKSNGPAEVDTAQKLYHLNNKQINDPENDNKIVPANIHRLGARADKLMQHKTDWLPGPSRLRKADKAY